MCGIAGIRVASGIPDQTLLQAMSDAIAHRGPNDEGIEIFGNVGLVNRRLAVIDLSKQGHQPMSRLDGRVWLTFNGEIYNHRELRAELIELGHRFVSQSDTEVVLAAYVQWGREFIGRLRGMFAFAIFDAREDKLLLVRDRIGIKPLYYATAADGSVLFASEIKALRCRADIGRRIRADAVAQFWAFTHLIDYETWFEGVHQLPPAHWLEIDSSGNVHSGPYWNALDHLDTRRGVPIGLLEDELRQRLEEAVHLHTISDVPIGAHLSGGLDSSTVVALLSRESDRPVETFSGAFAEGQRYDEREYIDIVVTAFNTSHHQVIPTLDDFERDLSQLMYALDEPVVSASAFAQYEVCRLIKSSGVIVVNGGQGGDEIFGGYPRYLTPLLWSRSPWRALQMSSIQAYARRAMFGGRMGGWITGLRPEFIRRLSVWPRKPRIAGNPTRDQMLFDLMFYLPALLQVEDRTSMAFSLESRVPFLDHHLVEFALGVPAEVLMEGGRLKALFRRSVDDWLPDAIVNRADKRGFPTPIDVWMRGPGAEWIFSQISGCQPLSDYVFRPGYLDKLMELHRRGASWTTHPLWSALAIATWAQNEKLDLSFAQISSQPGPS